MKRTHVFLPEPVIERLKELSGERDVSTAELIRRALEVFLEEQSRAESES